PFPRSAGSTTDTSGPRETGRSNAGPGDSARLPEKIAQIRKSAALLASNSRRNLHHGAPKSCPKTACISAHEFSGRTTPGPTCELSNSDLRPETATLFLCYHLCPFRANHRAEIRPLLPLQNPDDIFGSHRE